MLTAFLNAVLPNDYQLSEVKRVIRSRPDLSKFERDTIIDFDCMGINREECMVMLQSGREPYSVDRNLYYALTAIQKRMGGEEHNFLLPTLIVVNLLNFRLARKSENPHSIIRLSYQDGTPYFKGLLFVNIEFPKFTKELGEVKSSLDHWLYFIKHIKTWNEIPEEFAEGVFPKAAEALRLTAMSERELATYAESYKIQRDWHNILATAREEAYERGYQEALAKARRKGREEVRNRVRRRLEADGMSAKEIEELLGNDSTP